MVVLRTTRGSESHGSTPQTKTAYIAVTVPTVGDSHATITRQSPEAPGVLSTRLDTARGFAVSEGDSGMVKELPLSAGKVATVDDHWYPILSLHKWTFQKSKTCVQGEGYAIRYSDGGRTSRRRIFMHHVIHPPRPGFLVDHVNGDTLDNQEHNLRDATSTQNQANRGLNRDNTSGYKGVTLDRKRQLWRAQIRCEGKQYDLGRYQTREAAARAYNEAAARLFGAFAFLNEVA